jgi:glutathione S-transferase
MLTLYNAPHSTCSQKVRICLAEKGLAFEDIRLDLGKGKDQLKPEYLKLNPNGVVPTLVDDGHVIIDSSVICEYLDEKYPAPKLTPDDVVQRARMRAWMRYLEEVPTAAVRVPSFNMGFLPRFAGLDEASFRAEQSDIRPIRKHFYRRMGPGGFRRADVEAAIDRSDGGPRLFTPLDRQVSPRHRLVHAHAGAPGVPAGLLQRHAYVGNVSAAAGDRRVTPLFGDYPPRPS